MRITSFIAALFAIFLLAGQAEEARAGVFINITVDPPVLPVYVQPPVPEPGYIWTPGYWAWDDDAGDYYWVPGAWVEAPEPGLLWTPGYWGWSNGVYVWNAGYWGPHVGFYGGVSYGFGYTGVGFAGGYWAGGVYTYNRSVTNISGGVTVNVYNKTVINNHVTNVSYNGGNGGIRSQPSAEELRYANERHLPPSNNQLQHQQLASKNPDLKLASNRGKPSIAATSKAGDFSKEHVFAAKSAGHGFKPASLNHSTSNNARHDLSTSRATGNSNLRSQSLNSQTVNRGNASTTSRTSNNPAVNKFQRPTPPPRQPIRPAVKRQPPPPPRKDKKPG